MKTPGPAEWKSWLPPVLAAWLVLAGMLVWAYSGTVSRLVLAWWQQAEYGHGFFVPIFALVLLLVRSEMITGEPNREDWWRELLWFRPGWLAAALGAAVGILLFLVHFSRPADLSWEDVLGRCLVAGAFGGVLVGLSFHVARLFGRRQTLNPRAVRWSWWAMAFFGLWCVMRQVAAYTTYVSLDAYSLLPFLVGLTLFAGGWWVLRWAWPSIMFLFFMIPLPGMLASKLSYPLQWFGTKVTVFVIQTLGIRAVVKGENSNVISLTGGDLGVVEACSGLRMLMLFFAVCVGAAFIVRRPLWEKIVIVVSAVPIAIFANVMRLTVTAILYEAARWMPHIIDTEMADHIFHDWAGYFMMPLAMLVLWGELSLLNRLFLEPEAKAPLALGGPLAPGTYAAGGQASSGRDKQS